MILTQDDYKEGVMPAKKEENKSQEENTEEVKHSTGHRWFRSLVKSCYIYVLLPFVL